MKRLKLVEKGASDDEEGDKKYFVDGSFTRRGCESRKKETCAFHTMMHPWHSLLVLLLIVTSFPVSHAEGNSWERPLNMPRIQGLEVMCGAQHMEVHLTFDSPFQGLVASKGMYGHPNCVYVPPRSGKTSFVFNINYEQCGTKPDNHGKFYENTIVVQYDEELIEAWDEAKRLRCEWFNDYEKTATKTSPMVISDLEIVELNFHGDNVDCWMEIQEGRGPWAPPLTGIVPLGSTLTMVIAVKDPTGEFDMRVKACEASDGHNGHILPLSDSEGCILRPKLIGKFSKIKLDDGRATVLTYAFLSAFKFPDMLNVHMRCTVEICRHGCPDHCAPNHIPSGTTQVEHNEIPGAGSYNRAQEPQGLESNINPKVVSPNDIPRATPKSMMTEGTSSQPNEKQPDHSVPNEVRDSIREHIKQQDKEEQPNFANHGFPHGLPPPPQSQKNFPPPPLRNGPPPYQGRPYFGPPSQQRFPANRYPPLPPPGGFSRQPFRNQPQPGPLPPMPRPNGPPMMHGPGPHGQPNRMNNRADNKELLPEDMAMPRMGEPAPDTPPEQGRALGGMSAEPLRGEPASHSTSATTLNANAAFPKGPRRLRIRRAISSNNGIIGIEGAFKVVSEADLNFALNTNVTNQQPTVVLKGSRMPQSGDTIYGICLPRFGFGLVFFGLGLATVVAILTAIFLAYAHYIMKSNNKKSVEGYPAPNNIHNFRGHQNALPMVILRKMW